MVVSELTGYRTSFLQQAVRGISPEFSATDSLLDGRARLALQAQK
jgi:hypothetical protein